MSFHKKIYNKKDECNSIKNTPTYRIEYYRSNFQGSGGIFNNRTRGKLLGSESFGKGKQDTKSSTERIILGDKFWHDIRENVRKSLVDLELFFEVAQDDQIDLLCKNNQVHSKDTTGPTMTENIFRQLCLTLFHNPIINNEEQDKNREDIAREFVSWGIKYILRENFKDASSRKIILKAWEAIKTTGESYMLPIKK